MSQNTLSIEERIDTLEAQVRALKVALGIRENASPDDIFRHLQEDERRKRIQLAAELAHAQ